MFYKFDREHDLIGCVSCGTTALYWQLSGHECAPSVYEQLKGALLARLWDEKESLEEGAIVEATARAFWREHAPAGVRQLAEWRDRVPEKEFRIFMFEGIVNTYLDEHGYMDGAENV